MSGIHTAALIVHLVGLTLGLGGAMLSDYVFVQCVRRRKVGSTMLLVVHAASNLVIVGFLLLVASGIALVATGSPTTHKFWAKMVVVLILGVNGTVAHKIIFPRLERKINRKHTTVTIGFLHQMSVVAAVSGVSWFTALILGAWKTTAWPVLAWVVVYLLALSTAVAVSLLITPTVLRVEDPEFEGSFPMLATRAERANFVYQRKAISERSTDA